MARARWTLRCKAVQGARADGGGVSRASAVPSPGKPWQAEPPRLALPWADKAQPGKGRLPDYFLPLFQGCFSQSSSGRLPIFPTLTRRRSEKKKNPFADLPPPLTTLSLQELRADSSRSWSAWRPQRGPCRPAPPRRSHLVSAESVHRRRRCELRAFCQLTYLVLALGVLGCLLPLFSPVNHRTVLSALAPQGRRGGVRPV